MSSRRDDDRPASADAPAQAVERLALLDGLLHGDLDDDHDVEIGDLLATLAEDLPAVKPSTSGWARLARAVDHEPHAPVAPRLADLLQVPVAVARTYLARLSDPSIWLEMLPGAWIHHLQGGPELAGADVGFVKVDAHLRFPPHRHIGEERNLVITGALHHPDGTTFRAGDRFDLPAGGDHTFFTEEEPVLFAVVIWGVSFEDVDVPGR